MLSIGFRIGITLGVIVGAALLNGTPAAAQTLNHSHALRLDDFVLRAINSQPVLRLVEGAPSDTTEDTAIETALELETQAEASQLDPRHLMLGLELDAGIPFGVAGNIVYRPLEWLRIFVGAGYNLMAPGLRTGVSVGIPLHGAVRDVGIGFEAGHYFEGDVNALIELLANKDPESLALQHMSYNYVSGVLRLEMGTRVFRVVLELGVTYIHSSLSDLDVDLAELTGYENLTATNGTLRVLLPAGKLGIAVYVW